MRETYPLSNESRLVLYGHAGAVAVEMSVDESYLYQILGSSVSDPFAMFKRLYDAAVRAGLDTTPWDAAFAASKARYRGRNTASLAEKIRANEETNAITIEEMERGLDEQGEKRILRSTAKERSILDDFEVTVAIGDLRNFAKIVIEKRRPM